MGRTLMEKGGTEKNYHQDSTQHNLINRKWSFKEVERSLANIGWVLSLMANKSCQANTERASCKTIDHTVSLYQYLASYILFNDIYVTEGELLSQCNVSQCNVRELQDGLGNGKDFKMNVGT